MFVCRFSIEICLNYTKPFEREVDVDEWDKVNLIVG